MEGTRCFRTLIVDDDRLFRVLARTYLSTHERFEVVGEASDGVECMEALERETPDLILLDLMMPRMDGFEALPKICESVTHPIVVVHTSLSEPDVTERVRRLGASAVLEKAGPLRALPERILAALAGDDEDRAKSGPAAAWPGVGHG